MGIKKLVAEPEGEIIKYVISDNDEPFASGEYAPKAYRSGDVCAAAIREKHSNSGGYFCEIGDKRTAFCPCGDFKTGDFKLLQVKASPRGSKGAELSEKISFSGRYVVLEFSPLKDNDKSFCDIKFSKKISDSAFIKNAKLEFDLLFNESAALIPNYNVCLIVRTEAESLKDSGLRQITDEAKEQLDKFKACLDEFNRRSKERNFGRIRSLGLLSFVNQTYRIACFDEITVSDSNLHVMLMDEPCRLRENLRILPPSKNGFSLFSLCKSTVKLPSLLGRRIPLKSGGEIVIEKTEAMTVIDVNASSSKLSHHDVNIEAAKEIMRQLMLRNIGGIVMCDFINTSVAESFILLELLDMLSKDDYTKCQVHGITKLGIVEISRKRV